MLTAPAATNEAHVGEGGHSRQHKSDSVAQLAAVVLVVSGAYDHPRSVADVSTQRHHAEHVRKRLVGAPVARQRRASEVRAVGANEMIRRPRRGGRRRRRAS